MAEHEEILNKIFDPRKCPHEKVELRNKKTEKGTNIYWNQCLICGQKASDRISKKEIDDPSKVPLFDNELQQSTWKTYHEDYAREKALLDYAERSKLSEEYNIYLRTPEWKALSKSALERDHYRCQGCLNNRATEVHHLTYEHIYEEFLFELVSVCRQCHDRLHPDKV